MTKIHFSSLADEIAVVAVFNAVVVNANVNAVAVVNAVALLCCSCCFQCCVLWMLLQVFLLLIVLPILLLPLSMLLLPLSMLAAVVGVVDASNYSSYERICFKSSFQK